MKEVNLVSLLEQKRIRRLKHCLRNVTKAVISFKNISTNIALSYIIVPI